MPASTRESILDNLVTVIDGITSGGGYNYTAKDVSLGLKHFGAVPEDGFPAAYVAGADEKAKNSAQGQFTSELIASVIGYVYATDAQDIALLERQASRWCSDIRKALMLDVTRGGCAITTEVGDIDFDKGALAPVAGFEMFVRIVYRAATSTP